MKYIVGNLSGFALLLWWLAGIVLASGFWSTVFAIWIPPWALYLVVERVIRSLGWT